MKKILITGATGFIGIHAVQLLLKQGFEVHAVTSGSSLYERERLNWYQLDLLDIVKIDSLCESIQASHLLHLAWVTDAASYWDSIDNFHWLKSSIQLFDSFINHGGKRIVCSGSCAEYDWSYGYCSEELTPCNGSSPYESSKRALSSILTSFSEKYGVSAACGRPFYLFGPNEKNQRLVPYIVTNLLKNNMVFCRNGNLIRDYLYVEDVADAFVQLLISEVEGIINIASGRPIVIRDLFYSIGEKLNKKSLIQINDNLDAKEATLVLANTERLNNELLWTPSYNFKQAIDRTLSWWDSNI